jgi:hypothetical protein
VNAVDLRRQAAELHEYLVKKMGHNWRLATWEKKYEARLRVYGLEKCKVAVDGFASIKWWVENKSQDAPDCIFRSDKSFERFFAAGMKLPEHSETNRKREREEVERRRITVEVKRQLEANTELTARMQEKLEPMREELHRYSFQAFIEPLMFVRMEKGIAILFHENAAWVQEYYGERIAEKLGVKVKVVNSLN